MPTISELSAAITAIASNTEYNLRGTDLDTDLEWLGKPSTRPTNTEIMDKVAELAALAQIKWDGLLQEFLTPGNVLYESVLEKAIGAGNLAYHRFQNLQQLLSNPSLRSPKGLAFAITQLSASLTGENALTPGDVEDWNALMDDHAFPPFCKLPEAP